MPCLRHGQPDVGYRHRMQVAGALQAQPSYRTWGALPRKDPWLSLGIGGSFELDQMAVVPAMRVRFQDWLTIKVRNFTRGIRLAAPVLCAKLTSARRTVGPVI